MTRRMIDSAMWSNENFAALPVMARLLQVGIINMADDQGRVKAFPAYLRSQVFPYDDVSIDDIRKWLQVIAQNGTIAIYQADGKEYIQLLNWWEYQSLQYPAPSEYPSQPGWQDRVRYNAKGGVVLTYNYTTMKGERLPDTCDPRGNPLVRSYGRPPEQPPVTPQGYPPGQSTWDIHLDNPPGTPVDIPLEAPIQDQVQDQDQQEEQNDDEDTHARDPVHAAWFETYEAEMPEQLEQPIAGLVVECGLEATIHGIRASTQAKERTFKYVAKCARNYIPPPPESSAYTNGYHAVPAPIAGQADVEPIPGFHALTPPARSQSQALPPPMATDDPWTIVLAELLPTLSKQGKEWLEDSELDMSGELAGEPLFSVIVYHPGANAEWLERQIEPVIRKKLGSIVGKRVNIDFSLQPTSVPTVHA